VRRNAGELRHDHTNRLAARRDFEFCEAFDGDGVSDVVRQRREVIQPVRVGHELVVRHVLRDLFVTAMQITDDRVALRQDLAVEFQLQPQDPVRGRVRWPHRKRHLFRLKLLHSSRSAGGGIRKGKFGGHCRNPRKG
jgi:hypothetical protein